MSAVPLRSKELVRTKREEISTDVQEDLNRAEELFKKGDAENTKRAYGFDLKCWNKYAMQRGIQPEPPIPPAALAGFIAYMDKLGLRISTIERRCAALSRWHREKELPSPTKDPKIRKIISGLKRERQEQPRRKKPATSEVLEKLLPYLSTREKAILFIGYGGAMRRSEIAALEWTDIQKVDGEGGGYIILIRKSKTDQEGKGRVVGILEREDALCAVKALEQWRAQATSCSGRVFDIEDGEEVSQILKQAVKEAGVGDPDDWGGHSLRAGFATEADSLGASIADIMAHTGHKTVKDVMKYIRSGQALQNRAAQKVAARG